MRPVSIARGCEACRGVVAMTAVLLSLTLAAGVAYVSLLERGGRNPPVTTVCALARALHVSPRELIDAS